MTWYWKHIGYLLLVFVISQPNAFGVVDTSDAPPSGTGGDGNGGGAAISDRYNEADRLCKEAVDTCAAEGCGDLGLGTCDIPSPLMENICFNSDSSIFASYDEEGIIKLWNLPKGRLIKTLEFKREYGELLSFGKEDNIIFRYKNRLYFIDSFEDQVKKVKEVTYFTIPKNFVSSDGKTSLTLHERYDNNKTYYSVKVWNIETDKLISELKIEMAKRLVVTLSATGKFAAFLWIERNSLVVEIYNLKQGILTKRGVIKNKDLINNFTVWHENNSNSIALSSDAKHIVVGPDKLLTLYMYNTSNFKSEKRINVPGDFSYDFKVYFSGDGRFLSVEDKNRSYTECWQIEGWKKISENCIRHNRCNGCRQRGRHAVDYQPHASQATSGRFD